VAQKERKQRLELNFARVKVLRHFNGIAPDFGYWAKWGFLPPILPNAVLDFSGFCPLFWGDRSLGKTTKKSATGKPSTVTEIRRSRPQPILADTAKGSWTKVALQAPESPRVGVEGPGRSS